VEPEQEAAFGAREGEGSEAEIVQDLERGEGGHVVGPVSG
jgi:hypothetical protein